jgi:hypothetical protein
MKRRLLEQRWRLRHSPVHGVTERFERSMDRRELDPFRVVRLGLEAIDLVGFLERIERQLTEVSLQHRDPTAD